MALNKQRPKHHQHFESNKRTNEHSNLLLHKELKLIKIAFTFYWTTWWILTRCCLYICLNLCMSLQFGVNCAPHIKHSRRKHLKYPFLYHCLSYWRVVSLKSFCFCVCGRDSPFLILMFWLFIFDIPLTLHCSGHFKAFSGESQGQNKATMYSLFYKEKFLFELNTLS